MRCAKIAVIVCLLAWAAVAAAQGTCSTEMLQGTYVVEHTGLVYMGVNAPYTLLGTATADRDGNVQSKWVHVSPFGNLQYTQSGHWTVTPDCYVTLTHLQSGVVVGVSEGVAVNNGAELRMMITAPLVRTIGGNQFPAAGSGTFHRMSPGANNIGNCSNAMLKGTYAQTCSSGFLTLPSTIPGLAMTFMSVRGIITLTANGDGTAEGSGNLVFGGAIHPGVYQNLKYEVDPDCWASATFDIAGIPGTWSEAMVIFDQGKEMLSTTLSSPLNGQDLCRFTRIKP